jgi:hypothetical protein
MPIHPNPFYRISNTLWMKQINPNEMEVDEALYHISILIYEAEQYEREIKIGSRPST